LEAFDENNKNLPVSGPPGKGKKQAGNSGQAGLTVFYSIFNRFLHDSFFKIAYNQNRYIYKEICMKKSFLTFLVLALMAGGLSAQGFTWSGVFNSGLGLVSSDQGSDPYVTAAGVDSGTNGYRLRLNGAYTNQDSNAGFRVRIQSQNRLHPVNDADTGGLFSLPYAYGWIKPLDILTLTGGLVDDGTWATGVSSRDAGEGLGLLVKLSPITGLDLGLGAYVLTLNSGGNNNTLPVANLSNVKVLPEDLKYTLGLAYTLTDVFKASLAFRTKNKTYNDTSSMLIAGVNVLALKPLNLSVEILVDKLEDFEKIGTLEFGESLSYALGDLTVGLNAGEYISNVEGKDDLALRLNPYVSYALGSLVPRLDLTYFLAGNSNFPVYNYSSYAASYDADTSLLSVRPSVKIKIDGNTTLEVGDFIALDQGKTGAYATAGDPDKDTRFSNVFYLDLNWKF
jgi:hypothetical protein